MAILTASMQHYDNLFAAGKQALAPDTLSFYQWRQSSHAEQDLSFLDAFTQADAAYTAANEPQAIVDWRDDMSDAQVALAQWVQEAVQWQAQAASDADLAAAEQKFHAAMAKAKADVAAIAHR